MQWRKQLHADGMAPRQRANRGAADTGNAPCPTGATEKTNTKPAYGLFGLANKSNKQRLALKRQT